MSNRVAINTAPIRMKRGRELWLPTSHVANEGDFRTGISNRAIAWTG
jgi:hypothetical protein